MLYRLYIVRSIASGSCDYIYQCIIVRTNHCTYHQYYSSKSSKIYRCWIVWGQNIRVVIIPSLLAIAYLGQSIYLYLISRFQSIASSFLDSGERNSNICTWPNVESRLGEHNGFNEFHFVHGREYPGDGLDRVQDPQGILTS